MLRFIPFFSGKKDRRLGSAQGRRRYDLPLDKSVGTGFLVLLITLMTFLGVMALSAFFVLGSVSERWSSGLENRVSIEIPAEKSGGALRNQKEIAALSDKAHKALETIEGIENIEVMGTDEVKEMISPWLGEDLINAEIPLPGLLSVKMDSDAPHILRDLRKAMHDISKDITVDTHKSWLSSLLHLTGALEFSAALLIIMIGVTTITSIAGAVRSRMAIHHEDVELLHVMGASDSYISRQFQRHAMVMAFKGGLAGILAGGIVLWLISLIAGDTGAALLPDFSYTKVHIISILSLPLVACAIAATTARYTVLSVVAKMP